MRACSMVADVRVKSEVEEPGWPIELENPNWGSRVVSFVSPYVLGKPSAPGNSSPDSPTQPTHSAPWARSHTRHRTCYWRLVKAAHMMEVPAFSRFFIGDGGQVSSTTPCERASKAHRRTMTPWWARPHAPGGRL